MILARGRSNSITDIKALNMWGFHLRDISILEQMTNLEVVALPINAIETLRPLRGCVHLRELFLRQNQIPDFEELRHLQDLQGLRSLALIGNPIANLPRYRETVIAMLPQLTKLDDREITEAERRPPALIPSRRSAPMFPTLADNDPIERRHSQGPQFDPASPRDDPPRTRQPPRRDQAALTAVLALLPELSADSLAVVLEAIAERSRH
jgi:hypothetical protein